MPTQHFTKFGLYTIGLGLTLVMVGAVAALAGTAFTDFNVNANVTGACTIAASTLAFGDYAPPPSTSNLDNASSLTVTCVNNTNANIGLNQGNNATGGGPTTPERRLSDGSGHTLRYDLYRDAGRSAVWGDTGTVNVRAYTGTGAQESITVFGRIPAGQAVPTGPYTDTVRATISF